MKPIAFEVPRCTSPENPLRIIPLSCAHFPDGDRELLLRWRDEIRKPNTYTILVGDQFDAARRSFRDHTRGYRKDDNSQLIADRQSRADVLKFATILRPIKDRIMGILHGNHYWEFSDGITSDQLLCHELGVAFLGEMAFVRLECGGKNTPSKATSILKLVAHHTGGCSGTRTRSGDMAALQRFQNGFDADIYIAGHTHRAMSDLVDVLTIPLIGEPIPILRTKAYIRAGSLLAGYKLDNPLAESHYTPNYAETRAYSPSDLGWVELAIWWTRKSVHGIKGTRKDVDIAKYKISRSQ